MFYSTILRKTFGKFLYNLVYSSDTVVFIKKININSKKFIKITYNDLILSLILSKLYNTTDKNTNIISKSFKRLMLLKKIPPRHYKKFHTIFPVLKEYYRILKLKNLNTSTTKKFLYDLILVVNSKLSNKKLSLVISGIVHSLKYLIKKYFKSTEFENILIVLKIFQC